MWLSNFDLLDGDLSVADLFWLVVALLVLHGVWLVVRWRFIKQGIFPEVEKESAPKKAAPDRIRKISAASLHRILQSAEAAINAESSASSGPLLAAWQKAEPHLRGLSEAAAPVVMQAMEQAQLDSLILDGGGDCLYLVVVPNRHEHAHLLRRYATMERGWLEHFAQVRTALLASNPAASVLAFMLFLSPDLQNCVLLVSWANDSHFILPAGLTTRDDLREPGVLATDARREFALENTPLSVPS